MRHFSSDGVSIAYYDEGEGVPVLLIHGFASNKNVNWRFPGWVDTLKRAGYRVIAVDNRGHGDSEKLYESEHYTSPLMAEDAKNLLDHLEIEQAHVMGYSMGARISAFLSMKHADRVRSVTFGGLGINMVHGIGGADEIAEALLANDIRDVETRQGRAFRAFADQTGSDRKALAACILASRDKIDVADVAGITVPSLVAVGSKDDVAGSGEKLAALIPNAEFVDITGRDHMVAVGDKLYKQGVLEFLGRLEGKL
jgi:pimeloyl-ACP methyl ester carboxylesterase